MSGLQALASVANAAGGRAGAAPQPGAAMAPPLAPAPAPVLGPDVPALPPMPPLTPVNSQIMIEQMAASFQVMAQSMLRMQSMADQIDRKASSNVSIQLAKVVAAMLFLFTLDKDVTWVQQAMHKFLAKLESKGPEKAQVAFIKLVRQHAPDKEAALEAVLEDTPDVRQSTATRARRERGPCKHESHTPDTCWELHPELRPKKKVRTGADKKAE